MVVSQEAHAVGEDLLVQGERFTQPARRLVGTCEVVAKGECVGVVVSQEAHAVGEHLLVQGDSLVQAPRRLVGTRQVVAGGEGVGVVVSQDLAEVVHRTG